MPRDLGRLLWTRALRGFADGFASVVLVAHLAGLGFGAVGISAIVTATLLGSAATTLLVGLVSDRLPLRTVLIASSGVMIATGVGLAWATGFWPILAIAFLGTLNPSMGDVTLFLPTEQSLLARNVEPERRTAVFARYNLAGALLGAAGGLASGLPERAAAACAIAQADALRAAFVAYAAIGLACALVYLGLRAGRRAAGAAAAHRPLASSRGVVLRLAALFSLDSFGGGFAVQSILALWLFRRFDFSLAQAGSLFFGMGLLAAFSQLASAPLARRIGLVRTMVYTHIPANCFLAAAAFMPTAPLAVACLLARMATSSMDVPARQALVMGVVPPEEQAAAASVTNVPRSLATAFAPLLAGLLIEHAWIGWPLLLGGALKIAYDLLLLAMFRTHPIDANTRARP
jgi:MFS family permease